MHSYIIWHAEVIYISQRPSEHEQNLVITFSIINLFSLIFSAIAIVLLTSRMFKSVFDALPDTYNAVQSADSVVLLTSEQPVEDEYHITPVS